jgi:hypothetical protein
MTRDQAHEYLANKGKAAVAAYAADLARRGFDTTQIHERCGEYAGKLAEWHRSSMAAIDAAIRGSAGQWGRVLIHKTDRRADPSL